MARPGLSVDRKFKRAARELDEFQAGFGTILVRGALESIWDAAYEALDDFLGDANDVEALAEWHGPAGRLVKALVEAGGPGKSGFVELRCQCGGDLDEHRDGNGCASWRPIPSKFYVHDLWDHAPTFIRRRLVRETEREETGRSLHDLRAEAGRKGAAAANAKRKANGRQTDDNQTANGRQTNPSPEVTPPLADQLLPVAESLDMRAANGGQLSSTGRPSDSNRPTNERPPDDERTASERQIAALSPHLTSPQLKSRGDRSDPIEHEGPPAGNGAAASPPLAASEAEVHQTQPAPAGATQSAYPHSDPSRTPCVAPGPPWKLTEAFRRALADRMALTEPQPVGGGIEVFRAMENALARHGVEQAVEFCYQRDLDAVARRRPRGRTLAYWARVLAEDDLHPSSSPSPDPRVGRAEPSPPDEFTEGTYGQQPDRA